MKANDFPRRIYRRLHRHEYFTPSAVMKVIEDDTAGRNDEDKQLRVVIGNPPYTTEDIIS